MILSTSINIMTFLYRFLKIADNNNSSLSQKVYYNYMMKNNDAKYYNVKTISFIKNNSKITYICNTQESDLININHNLVYKENKNRYESVHSYKMSSFENPKEMLNSSDQNLIFQSSLQVVQDFILNFLEADSLTIDSDTISLSDKSLEEKILILFDNQYDDVMKYFRVIYIKYLPNISNSQAYNDFYLAYLKLLVEKLNDKERLSIFPIVNYFLSYYWSLAPANLCKEIFKLSLLLSSTSQEDIEIDEDKIIFKLSPNKNNYLSIIENMFFMNMLCIVSNIEPLDIYLMPEDINTNMSINNYKNQYSWILEYDSLLDNFYDKINFIEENININEEKYMSMCIKFYQNNALKLNSYNKDLCKALTALFIEAIFINKDISIQNLSLFKNQLKALHNIDNDPVTDNEYFYHIIEILHYNFNSYCNKTLTTRLIQTILNILSYKELTIPDMQLIFNIKNNNFQIELLDSIKDQINEKIILTFSDIYNDLSDIQKKYFIQMINGSELLSRKYELKSFLNAQEFNFLKIINFDKDESNPYSKENSLYDYPDLCKNMVDLDNNDKIKSLNVYKYLSRTKSSILQKTITNSLLLLYAYNMLDITFTDKNEIIQLYRETLNQLLMITYKSNKTYKKHMLRMLKYLKIASTYGRSTVKIFSINQDYSHEICKIYFDLVNKSYLSLTEKLQLTCKEKKFGESIYPFMLPIDDLINILAEVPDIDPQLSTDYLEEYLQ